MERRESFPSFFFSLSSLQRLSVVRMSFEGTNRNWFLSCFYRALPRFKGSIQFCHRATSFFYRSRSIFFLVEKMDDFLFFVREIGNRSKSLESSSWWNLNGQNQRSINLKTPSGDRNESLVVCIILPFPFFFLWLLCVSSSTIHAQYVQFRLVCHHG